MNSITYRITGMMFLGILLTVIVLVNLANYQMKLSFEQYLVSQHMEISQMTGMYPGRIMGLPEKEFIESFHRSLFWVGGAILFVGLVASYLLAQSITVPLRQLSAAADAIGKGAYGKKVNINSGDEVGHLAMTFNRMSQSLKDSKNLRERFLADIAHELKTPLAVIQGNLEGMLDGVIERSDEQLSSLHEETIHLNRMIRDLRDLTLADAGQLVLEKALADVNSLITRALTILEPMAEEKGINFEKRLGRIPEIQVDAGRINQVFYNLLTNAIRYTPEGGRITVSTDVVKQEGKRWVKIEVSDTGIGIPNQELPFIFEQFYRVDRSRDKKSGGSGIGLAIVKRLVESHGGKAEVSSEFEKGSSFFVYLPI